MGEIGLLGLNNENIVLNTSGMTGLICSKYEKLFDEKFLQFDNLNDDNRIIILLTSPGKKILCQSKRWHFDGTFKTTPKLFYQMLIQI